MCRHNTYLQECTAVRDATYAYTIHDLKHLLIKFALEKSFSEDSGGGGRESNMYLVPYIMHMALYVINTSVSLDFVYLIALLSYLERASHRFLWLS